MTHSADFTPSTRYWAETHKVENQPPALENYNAFTSDAALQQSLMAQGGEWARADLEHFGALTGSAEVIEWGYQANENKPVLHTHNRHGARVDEVKFHPAYHQLMNLSIKEGIHALHWTENRPAGHVVRAAKYYLMNQVEAGHGCPVTMTSAAIPALRHQPDLYQQWAPKILSSEYDPRNVPHEQKAGVTIGMAMTEKQGGSDVRTNSTRAYPVAEGGPGQAYELVGHKYFVSAPMCDAFLVLAQTESGVSCFLVPRWRPDGTKNPLQIQKLKNKMGNVSNASSETELRGALGWMVGEEGRGVPTIIDMVAMTRFDCMIGSAAGMRQAVAQITHHCSQRMAFGKLLTEQPLMQNVLADLIIEQEAALALTMRIGRALDRSEHDEQEKQLVRMGTAVGKYWICKRAPGHAYEAMECIGGMGVMEDGMMPRLYREAPINTIWEGSGNVQCLDMLRAMAKSPGSLSAFMAEISKASGLHPNMDQAIVDLAKEFEVTDNMEYRARAVVEKMALAIEASSLLQFGDGIVADAFCRSRLGSSNSGWVYGTLPEGIDCKAIIQRATPSLD
ncbi:DNA alkylation response protein [Aestuariicella hydrocarbonica]|uniref:DNA alkylation response protein n=1 Tax=Pseudomaricurvus hydrocarbonicus TaxID=1470433 RepID=A0A9E5T3M8_9GAMM|nr:acyl-CoA dehydrogenase family protein [Aestuariicella hydrocarbonica]NHO67129.1 DNA alkylation response protein [Aestuariicella hydrocarbonica]